MPNLDSTLAAIDAATGCQQCGKPLGNSPSGDYCGETCQAAWTAGLEGPLAPTTIEWRHPYAGEVVEPLCDAHVAQVRASLSALAIGHVGRPTNPPAGCYRCVDKREPRYWIDRFPGPHRRKGEPMTSPRALLQWHYGPTWTDPDPGKRWCYDCRSEVWTIDEVDVCSGCGLEGEDASSTCGCDQP